MFSRKSAPRPRANVRPAAPLGGLPNGGTFDGTTHRHRFRRFRLSRPASGSPPCRRRREARALRLLRCPARNFDCVRAQSPSTVPSLSSSSVPRLVYHLNVVPRPWRCASDVRVDTVRTAAREGAKFCVNIEKKYIDSQIS